MSVAVLLRGNHSSEVVGRTDKEMSLRTVELICSQVTTSTFHVAAVGRWRRTCASVLVTVVTEMKGTHVGSTFCYSRLHMTSADFNIHLVEID